MRALTWQGNEHVEVTDVPDPVIQEPNDIVIRVTSTAICGSDLHLYGVLGPFLKPGDVLGHEPMGIVEETGADITHLRAGDRVVIPFNISCGHCWMCERGLFAQCETTQGPDAVIDAVGMEAHGHDEPRSTRLIAAGQKATGLLPDSIAAKVSDRAALDRLDALHTAVKAVRRGGTVSVSGVYGGEVDPMPLMEMFDRGVQLRMGQAHVRRWIDDLLPIVGDDRDPLGVREFATHHLPLEDAPRGYEIFRDKAEGCLKVVLQP
jgi:threonine dehydrogenase-like Zn-dependent dehydrogenase